MARKKAKKDSIRGEGDLQQTLEDGAISDSTPLRAQSKNIPRNDEGVPSINFGNLDNLDDLLLSPEQSMHELIQGSRMKSRLSEWMNVILEGEGCETVKIGELQTIIYSQKVQEVKNENKREVTLTFPLSLDGISKNDYKPPNVLQMVFSLLNNVRPGADLTRFQLPPLFNLPKSHLQCYGESVYCVNKDMLSKCANGETAVDRMISVVAWSISTIRPLMFGVAPYNPILGETHHASRGTLHVLLEQVSHHPPVSALHATDETNGVELIWCQHAVPKFQGATIETVVHGRRKLNLVNKGESYVMNAPKLLIRLLPKLGVDWVGNVRIKCQETSLEAELSFKSGTFLGFGGSRSVKGKIIDSSTLKTLYEIHGQWDRIVNITDTIDGKTKVLYDAREVISTLPALTLRDPEEVWQSESGVVWGEVSKGILSKEWDKAREAKRTVEERERELLKQRKSMGEDWFPKHFDLSYSTEFGWECTPKEKTIPPAPIIFPI